MKAFLSLSDYVEPLQCRNLKHPGDDARLDLTDLFVYAAPATPTGPC
jgi:hypothetical protein